MYLSFSFSLLLFRSQTIDEFSAYTTTSACQHKGNGNHGKRCGLRAGAAVGAGVGGVLGVIAIVSAAYIGRRYRRRNLTAAPAYGSRQKVAIFNDCSQKMPLELVGTSFRNW